MPLAKAEGVSILPVDSEHSAIYQSIGATPYSSIEKVILTASGGPFRGKTHEELKSVTLKDALKHPNWEMGAKITIDSSTLMNKGLEVIEAKWLFDVEPEQIDVVVHPQSILHSMVQYIDGSCIGQMGLPDMKLPIQFALYEEERKFMPYERLDLVRLGQLTFEQPDKETFRCLSLAYKALELGKEIPTVLNAANEKAVELFIKEKISYLDIPLIIEATMDYYVEHLLDKQVPLSFDLILETEKWTYTYISERWQS
jgi:1-deoxy-D-xylulose-5-phosphate reductoisomerase